MAQNHHNRDMDIDVPVEDDYEEAESESVISRIAPMILIAILIIAIIAVLGFGFVNLAKRAPRTNNYIQNEMQTTSETTAVSFEFVEIATTAPHTSTAVTSATTTDFYDNFYESTRYSGKKSTTAVTESTESGTMTTADTLESGTDAGISGNESTTVRRYTDQNGTTRNITTETETVTAPPVIYTTQRPAETTRRTEPVQVITEKPETAPPMTSPQEPEPETAPPITNPPETAPPVTSPREPEPEAPETAPPLPSYEYDEE